MHDTNRGVKVHVKQIGDRWNVTPIGWVVAKFDSKVESDEMRDAIFVSWANPLRDDPGGCNDDFWDFWVEFD